ncbi:melanoma inhibitory activity protein 2 isoform X5 [Dipodomys merriami]|uniref:melanoma inhibitory activity protein 2 isoform X5 n=1 Tax=Dipodomys merriami TaxID=94247 RepID=UPI00384C07C1
MAELTVHRLLLLFFSLAKCLEGTKLLSHLKKCGDLECETLISRVLAMKDYTGPDCRFLNFTEGEEISVYIKLSGEREDLWAGSKGKDFGFFPRDAVQVEEVFIPEEVEISAKESDFLCLHGESYIFGSEDSELSSGNGENMYSYEEDEDQKYSILANDFLRQSGFYEMSASTVLPDQFLASEAPETMRSTSDPKDWEEVEAGRMGQDQIPEVDDVLTSPTLPEGQGWFGLGEEQTEDKTVESVTESVQENSFRSRKLAVEDENNPEESQTEHEPEPESEFDSEPPELVSVTEKESEQALELEHTRKSQATSWFGGGFTSYLGFGEESTELELLSKESHPLLQDIPDAKLPNEDATVPCTEITTEKEDTIINDSSIQESSWFDFGFGMLGFADADEENTISEDGKNSDSGLDKHKHPPASEFEPDKEQEINAIKMMEADQLDKKRVVEETDDSDATLYLKKILYNFDNPWSFQNTPEETELPSSNQILDENNKGGNDGLEYSSIENQSTDDVEDLIMLKSSHSQSDIISEIGLPVRIPEKTHAQTSSSKNAAQSTSLVDPEGPEHRETDTSVENTLQSSLDASLDNSLSLQNLILQKDDTTGFWILKYVFQVDIYNFMNSAFSPIIMLIERVVAALPEDMRPGPNPYGFPWELVICVAFGGFFAVALFLWRSFRSVRSRLYIGREKKLALELSGLIEEKCKLLEKFRIVQKEATYEKLDSSKSKLEDEILFLEKELKEEKSKHSEQEQLTADISKRIQSLEDESNSLKSQVAEAKTTFRVFQINEERLKGTIKDALNENSQLQESQEQLLQEIEVWKEQVSELNKQKITFEDSKVQAEQVLSDKEDHVKSLTQRLLKMKDWAAVLGEDLTEDGNWDLEMKSESESVAHLDNPPKGALKNLIYAAKLNASLKTLEGERNQIYIQLSEADKTKEDLTEQIKSLQDEQVSLQSENTEFESENQKLQQKLKVMTELYQENEMKLHRKLTVEENSRLEKEEKLSKVDEKISYAAEELENYRKRAKDLEEELERTIHSYQGQIISHEKKAHDNWLAARTAERNLNDLRKENAYNRQKLTETEFKFELLEKDPYALDVPNTAFGRGSRGPENPLDHSISNERGESGYDRLMDPHRAPSDTGSLSPPWEQDRRMMFPPSGQPYPDAALPLQRPDRFYSNSGRLSGPAELRSFNMPSLDKVDGPLSSEMESRGNDTKDDIGNSHMLDPSLAAEREAPGSGFAPPPLPPVRAPLFPVDPRNQFLRRAPPFPPPPPSALYGVPRDYFPPRGFPGPPPPPFPMRSVYPQRGFPQYLPPQAGLFHPAPHSESSSQFPSALTPASEPAAEPPKAQQEA